MCKGKENPTAFGLQPPPASPLCCSLLPRITPLGSSGGCQTIRTDVSLTSGNTSLTGGPGAGKRNRDHASRHCVSEELQVFCLFYMEGSPRCSSPIINRWLGAPTYIHNTFTPRDPVHGWMPPAPTSSKHNTELVHPTVFYCTCEMSLPGCSDKWAWPLWVISQRRSGEPL